jgi:hypothetical protein
MKGICTACPPIAKTGKISDFNEFPIIKFCWSLNRLSNPSNRLLVCLTSLQYDENWPRPELWSFLRWSNKSPLVATTSLYFPCKASSVSSTPSNKTIGFQVALCRIVIFSRLFQWKCVIWNAHCCFNHGKNIAFYTISVQF